MTNQEFFATLTEEQRNAVMIERKNTLEALQAAGYTINIQDIENAFNQALMLFGWA